MLNRVLSILKNKKYVVYEEPYKLNIVGLRSSTTNSNKFDDDLIVFFKDDKNKWVTIAWKITTDPGSYWLKNPISPKGTAILKAGQYVDAYSVGLHQGKYRALVQVKPVVVFRDYDRDAVLDWKGAKEEKGMFGINIHRASVVGTTYSIDRNSAGCQVFKDAAEYDSFMRLVDLHKSYHGNSFTYTLIDFREVRRATYRNMAKGTAFLILTGFIVKPKQ